MKLRLWILAALAAFALLISSTPVFKDAHQTRTGTQVFDTILAQGYAGWTGFHVCLTSSTPQHDICWAELHKGNRYRQVQLDIDLSHSNPIPAEVVHHEPWTRAPIHIAAPEGHGTANTREYGWEFMMRTLPVHKLPLDFIDVDGNAAYFPLTMFRFHCTGTPKSVTCRNSLGDEITYTRNNL